MFLSSERDADSLALYADERDAAVHYLSPRATVRLGDSFALEHCDRPSMARLLVGAPQAARPEWTEASAAEREAMELEETEAYHEAASLGLLYRHELHDGDDEFYPVRDDARR
ncbi:MAG: hypothetical protein BGO82_07790 [Devosia sp. 67-54]|nr:MAG: hypothetical protein BGO82_07790 [Devosia sp. 67-54]